MVVDQRLDEIRTHHAPHDAGTGAEEVPSSEVSGVPRIGLTLKEQRYEKLRRVPGSGGVVR
jgi:hypothetical protein